MPQVFKVVLVERGQPRRACSLPYCRRWPNGKCNKGVGDSAGKCLLANNNSNIPERALRNVIRVAEARSAEIVAQWEDRFGPAKFYL